ncbi:MAG: sigma-70 family RNA polymerase sigma factor [Thermoleophilaceae bacterium]|nr:sigma-70 family RNA polymerase sigma factor [Thermoleophilaceae bacterium]
MKLFGRTEDHTLQDLADEDLIAMAQRGDIEAFEILYDRHKGPAYSLARRITGTDGNADDVVQETFVSLWRSIERYDPRRASVRTWLMRIVHRRAIDQLRSQMVHAKRRADGEGLIDDLTAKEPAPEALTLANEQSVEVREALGDLPEDQRKVIELSYFSGFSQTEIAEMTGQPLGTVKGRMRLGLEKMRAHLELEEAQA